MKKIFAAISLVGSFTALAVSPDTTIWLDQPAKIFTESLPLGNGRLGAMDFGGIESERIALNEDSLWSGSVQNADRTNAAAALPEIRKLLLEGKNHEAEYLVNHNFTCAGRGSGNGRSANLPYGSYEALGDLRFEFSVCRHERSHLLPARIGFIHRHGAHGICARRSEICARNFFERAGSGRGRPAHGGSSGANYC